MPSFTLDLTLDAGERPGRFLLTCGDIGYPIDLRPETDVALGELLRRLPQALAGGSGPSRQAAPPGLLRDVGTWLWQAITPESAPAADRDRLSHALLGDTTPLRLRLPASLAVLPWELLCDPQQPQDAGFVARRRPLVRLVPGGADLPALVPPLRVLLLIAAPPETEEQRRVDVESERAAVEDATRTLREAGSLHLLVEDIVTVRRVQQLLLQFKPHILHYVGHGGYAEGLGVLEWEDDRGRPTPLADARLADLLRPRGLRAVLLHGCETATSDRRADFSGVAGALLGAGIPAVLAQQGKLSYESSQRASDMFYRTLTNGVGLAQATFEARQALAQADRPDWAVPVLQATAGGLLPLLDPTAPPAAADPALERRGAAADLPAPTGVFVGRQRELRLLRGMLESAPGSGPVLALISGPGGIGKSTLAAQAVARYGGRYRAALTLSCRGYQGFDLFLRQIGEFLKRQGAPLLLDEVLPDPQLGRQARTQAAIEELNRAGPFVLVVDNLESVQAKDRTLADPDLLLFLQTTLTALRGGRVLVTGRYAAAGLTPDDKFQSSLLRLDLDDLSDYETHRLLARHPALARLGEAVVDELVREFGGLPYMYDILSSVAASQDLTGLIYDFHKRKTQERRQRSAEEWRRVRRRVVEFAALEAVVARLSEPSRDLLARLSVFRRSFPLVALEQGLGAGRDTWQPLIDWALLRYDPVDRDYRLHSLTARYAADLLDDQRRPAAQLQAAEWYLRYGEHNSHELVNSLEAHRLLTAAGASERAGKLANGLADPFRRFGLYQTWRDLCLQTIRGPESSLTAEAWRQLGMIAYLQGRYDEARQRYQESLSSFERLGDQRGRANTLHQLGNIAYVQGRYDEARQRYQENLSSFEQLGDQRGYARTLHQLGNIAYVQGRYDEARQIYYESLAIKERLDDQGGRANTLQQLGMIAQDQGRYDEARQRYQEALPIFERLGDQCGRSGTLHQLGNIAYLQGCYDEARQRYQEALTSFEQLGDQRGRANTLHQLGMIAQDQGRYDEACQRYQEVLTSFERLGDERGRAFTLHQLGMIAQEQGRYDEACQRYQESLTIKKRLGGQGGRATTLHQLGMIAQGQGRYDEARQLYQEVLTIFERLDDQGGRAATLHQLGIIAQEQGRYDEARQLYQESLAIKERLGDQLNCAITLGQLGLLARQQGDIAGAIRHIVQALEIFELLQSPYRDQALRALTEIRAEVGEERFAVLWREVMSEQPVPEPPTVNRRQGLRERLSGFIRSRTGSKRGG